MNFDFQPLLNQIKSLFLQNVEQDTPEVLQLAGTIVADAEDRLPKLATAFAESGDTEFLKNRISEELQLLISDARAVEVLTEASAEKFLNEAIPLITNTITGVTT